MTTITAKIVLDSVGADAPRLTTMHLRYPRFIHAELMTHRVFSRNARSSRAVPIQKMIDEVKTDPVIPLHWGAAQKGMQAYDECDNLISFRNDKVSRESAWLRARDIAVDAATGFMKAGYAKQLVNRLLEPFMHIDVLVTSSDYENFLKLRDHHAAEPHIQLLAKAMKEAIAGSAPNYLEAGQWHLPYIDKETRVACETLTQAVTKTCTMASVARCARISYNPFDSDRGDVEADLQLADTLAKSGHWSPFEHQATPDRIIAEGFGETKGVWNHPLQHGNLSGWVQFRKTFDGENGKSDAVSQADE